MSNKVKKKSNKDKYNINVIKKFKGTNILL